MVLFPQMAVGWIAALVFLILLVLKLDGKMNVSWALTSIPLFIHDGIEMFVITLQLIIHFRNGGVYDSHNVTKERKCWNLFVWFCITLFQILLCLYLDNIIPGLRLYIALIPLWIALIGYNVDFMRYQLRVLRH